MGQQQIGPDLELIIKDMQRRLRDLEVAPRVPQVTQRAEASQFSQNITLTEYTRTPTGWGDLDGSPAITQINLTVPQNGRLLLLWGCMAGTWTTTAGGANERAGMGCRVGTTGVGATIYSGASDGPAMLIDELASHKMYANIAGFKVVGSMPPGANANASIEYYRANSSSFGVFFNNPWLTALPI